MKPSAVSDPLAELAASIHLHRDLASQAQAAFEAAIPVFIPAIRHQSGQSRKIERILWSVWAGNCPTPSLASTCGWPSGDHHDCCAGASFR